MGELVDVELGTVDEDQRRGDGADADTDAERGAARDALAVFEAKLFAAVQAVADLAPADEVGAVEDRQAGIPPDATLLG